jgi:hypothetical protein
MAGRVKGDCGANSMEHSFALTHLIPIGLWVMVIGCHLGSARVHLRRVGEKEFGRVGVFRDVEAGRMAPAEFLDTRSDRPEMSAARGRVTFSPRGNQASTERPARGKVPPREDARQPYFLIPCPMQNEPDGGTSARLAVDKLVSFIDRAVRQWSVTSSFRPRCSGSRAGMPPSAAVAPWCGRASDGYGPS